MRQWGVLVLVVLLAGAAIVALHGKPLTCAALAEMSVPATNFAQLQLSSVSRWAREHLPPTGEVGREPLHLTGDGYTARASWEHNSHQYEAYFSGSHFASLHSDLRGYAATAGRIIECEGEPDYYLAFVGGAGERYELVFELWYPDEGRIYHGAVIAGTYNTPERVTPGTRVGRLMMTEIAGVQEMALNTSATLMSGETRGGLLRPWQGWEQAVFETLPPGVMPP